MTPAAERVLANRPWDGNVRELRNTIERACMLAEGSLLTDRDVTRDAVAGGPGEAGAGLSLVPGRRSTAWNASASSTCCARWRGTSRRRRAPGHQPACVLPPSGAIRSAHRIIGSVGRTAALNARCAVCGSVRSARIAVRSHGFTHGNRRKTRSGQMAALLLNPSYGSNLGRGVVGGRCLGRGGPRCLGDGGDPIARWSG